MPRLLTMTGVYREGDSLGAVSFYSCEQIEGGSIVHTSLSRSDGSSTAATDLTLLAQTSESPWMDDAGFCSSRDFVDRGTR